jgi:prepilin-type N-terminal cleavage/methylation domain-containing protein
MRLIHNQQGFTFLELLAVIGIIGLLGTVGTVAYESARVTARDLRRVADINTIQTALEIYYQGNLSYPFDGAAGAAGRVLGLPETNTLSDDGFSSSPQGTLYLQGIPANPEPNGIPYLYRSLNGDGSDCDKQRCGNYQLIFSLEHAASGLAAGVHALTQAGVRQEAAALPGTAPHVSGSFATIALRTFDATSRAFAEQAAALSREPAVVETSHYLVAPVATVGLFAAIFTATPLAQLPHYFLFFFSQPFLFFTRRRRRAYGTVYDAYTKLPLDLVIVRVFDAQSGALVRSGVTDANGRFLFSLRRGTYRLEAGKKGYLFPSALLRGQREDGARIDLTHGETVVVAEDTLALTVNVPLDPDGQDVPDRLLLRRALRSTIRRAIAVSGPVLAFLALLAVPSFVLAALFVGHCVLYAFFQKVSIPRQAKTWGVVRDQETNDPVSRAVVRLFALPYHKLIASTVTDSRGRYQFLVGTASVYLTATKEGYEKTETEALDVTQLQGVTVLASDLPLQRRKG